MQPCSPWPSARNHERPEKAVRSKKQDSEAERKYWLCQIGKVFANKRVSGQATRVRPRNWSCRLAPNAPARKPWPLEHKMEINNHKKRFLTYELGLLTLKAVLSTRDANFPIYKKNIAFHQRSVPQKEFREILSEIENKYIEKSITEEEHINFISEVSSRLTLTLNKYLHNGRFRIGVAQKLINLHLKYLWVSGFGYEPHHCPIDGIIRDIVKLKYNWTQSDCINENISAIKELKKEAARNKMSLSEWELVTFRRKNDQL